MEPLTREQGTASQSIKLSALMLAAMVYVIISLIGPPRMHLNLVQQSKNRCAEGLALALIMPRARGRPAEAPAGTQRMHERSGTRGLQGLCSWPRQSAEVAPQHQIRLLEPM
jgi:hypothetical protein